MRIKVLLSIILMIMLSGCSSEATTLTLYHRDTSHTINGLNAYKVLLEQGSSAANIQVGPDLKHSANGGHQWIYANSTIYILHANTTTTTIATSVAQVSLSNLTGGTVASLLNANWTLGSDQSMVSTDALKIVITLSMDNSGGSTTGTFVTEQLAWSKLEAGTYAIYYYMESLRTIEITPPLGANITMTGWVRWGTSTYDTKIKDLVIIAADKGFVSIF